MKKSIFIMFFVSVISILSISNVKALNNPLITQDFVFPNESDLNSLAMQYDDYSPGVNSQFVVQCWHTNSSLSEVYCFIGNISFNPWLQWNNGNYSNIYNTDGFTSPNYNWYYFSNGTTYYSMAIYKWNNNDYSWSALCESVSNVCPNNYTKYLK